MSNCESSGKWYLGVQVLRVAALISLVGVLILGAAAFWAQGRAVAYVAAPFCKSGSLADNCRGRSDVEIRGFQNLQFAHPGHPDAGTGWVAVPLSESGAFEILCDCGGDYVPANVTFRTTAEVWQGRFTELHDPQSMRVMQTQYNPLFVVRRLRNQAILLLGLSLLAFLAAAVMGRRRHSSRLSHK